MADEEEKKGADEGPKEPGAEEKKKEEAPAVEDKKAQGAPKKEEEVGESEGHKGAGSLTSQSSGSETSASSLGAKRQSEYDKLLKGPKYQNTYRLNPKRPFKPVDVYSLMEEIVLRHVTELPQYDGFIASKLVQSIAAEVRTSVKCCNYDRYKICVFVILGEKKLQGYQCAFRALWDQERDSWTTYFYQCRAYFLSCTCFGLYHD